MAKFEGIKINKPKEYKGLTLACGKCNKGGKKGTVKKGAGKKGMIRSDILTIKK